MSVGGMVKSDDMLYELANQRRSKMLIVRPQTCNGNRFLPA
jgi:hypothetical protein